MQARARVRHVDPAADQPAAIVLIAIALLAMSAGVATAWWLGNSMSAPQGSEHAPVLAATQPAPPPAEPSGRATASEAAGVDAAVQAASAAANVEAGEPALSTTTIDAGAQRDAGGAPAPLAAATEPQVDDAPTPRPAPAPRASNEFVQGTVAYLRCDGLRQRAGPFPCPRDRELERAAWGLLARLPACAHADPGRGAAELRLELTSGGPAEARFLPRGDTPADVRSMERCAGAAARGLATTLRPDRMVVAFRFELRGAP